VGPRYPGLTSDLVVADLMTLDPVVIRSDASLEEAERLMRDFGVSGLPVIDDAGILLGVISQTDVVEDGGMPLAILLRRRPSGLRVGELMTSPAVTIASFAPLRDAARLMRDRRIHRLVAIDDAGRPIGVLSATDFVTLYAEEGP
jgi:CBS domain-containing protein